MTSPKVASIAAAIALLAPNVAAACDTIDNMSAMVALTDAPRDEIPDGMVQFKVVITERWAEAHDHSRSYFRARALENKEWKGMLTVIKPVGTSCHSFDYPGAGEYYLTGSFVRGRNDAKVRLENGALFQPTWTSRAMGLKTIKPRPDDTLSL